MVFYNYLIKKKKKYISYKKLIRLAKKKGKMDYVDIFIENCNGYFLSDVFKEENEKKYYANEIKSMILKLNEEFDIELNVEMYDKIAIKINNEFFRESDKKIKWWMM